jgi:HEPN domain-containing protein
MDPKKQLQLVAYWLEGSDRDYATAVDIINQTKRYASGLFFLHLSVEKSLKALYVKQRGEHAPFSHNLLHLAGRSGLQPDAGQETALAEINEFNLESRYPDERYSLESRATEAFAKEHLKHGEELRVWIKAALGK